MTRQTREALPRDEAAPPVRCPRCPVALPHAELIKHLWLEHRLLFADGREREPWRLVEEWIAGCAVKPDAALLAHCFEVARHLDPEDGVLRAQRLVLARGIDDPVARRDLLAEARRRQQTLCPRCFDLVPERAEVPACQVRVTPGWLSRAGYGVLVSERGLFSQLKVETPTVLLYRGHEPERWLTDKGTQTLLAGPPVFAALLLAVLFVIFRIPALVPVAGLLLCGLVGYSLVQVRRQPLGKVTDRVVDYAWTLLVPRLHEGGFSVADSAFVAGLALASIGRGKIENRRQVLSRLIHDTEQAVAMARVSVNHLAFLWRLALEDAAAEGRDPVVVVVSQVERALRGQLPLPFVDRLLGQWKSDIWDTGNLARLRVLLCDRAFEAGLEIPDLVELGSRTPALGDALHIHDEAGLAGLRLLWTLRAGRPWQRGADAATVFELAGHADLGRRVLSETPDLLLREASPEPRAESRVQISARGVIVAGHLFTEPPVAIEVKEQWGIQGHGYELIVGTQRFWFRDNPDAVARRLERWFRYFFSDFSSQVAAVHDWRSLGKLTEVQFHEPVRCPECGQVFQPRPGGVGAEVPAT
jgi:hypothetical protein